jgi:hypothetical protein
MTMTTAAPASAVRDFIYLDSTRVESFAAQLKLGGGGGGEGASLAVRERLYLDVEPALLGAGSLRIGPDFDFARWTAESFADGQFVRATGAVRLMDYNWLSQAVGGLPAVLKKMSKFEMEALKNSDEGRRMSKSQLQQRDQENRNAIAQVEAIKADELGDVVRRLYGDVVRLKVRPHKDHPRAMLVGSAYARHFYDTPGALSQKFGVEVDAGWVVVGQLNVPNLGGNLSPMPTGNQMEDSFEQVALMMNNALRLANAPAFPALSLTPIAIYRTAR